MRITWGSTITAGITASVAVVIFMIVIPMIIGIGTVDLTRDLGIAFSTQSPHVAGAVFLALMGVFWAAIFASVYNTLPGTSYLTKGLIFGLIVGLFSLTVLPNLLRAMDGIFGAPNQYAIVPFSLDIHAIITLIAYVIFGLTMAWSYRPSEITHSL